MLSPGLDTDVSVVSKAGVVPDLWNAMVGWGGGSSCGKPDLFIHSFIQQIPDPGWGLQCKQVGVIQALKELPAQGGVPARNLSL